MQQRMANNLPLNGLMRLGRETRKNQCLDAVPLLRGRSAPSRFFSDGYDQPRVSSLQEGLPNHESLAGNVPRTRELVTRLEEAQGQGGLLFRSMSGRGGDAPNLKLLAGPRNSRSGGWRRVASASLASPDRVAQMNKATVAEKHANGSHAAKAFWAGKSAEQRSTIMKARAAKRQRNRKRKP